MGITASHCRMVHGMPWEAMEGLAKMDFAILSSGGEHRATVSKPQCSPHQPSRELLESHGAATIRAQGLESPAGRECEFSFTQKEKKAREKKSERHQTNK